MDSDMLQKFNATQLIENLGIDKNSLISSDVDKMKTAEMKNPRSTQINLDTVTR